MRQVKWERVVDDYKASETLFHQIGRVSVRDSLSSLLQLKENLNADETMKLYE